MINRQGKTKTYNIFHPGIKGNNSKTKGGDTNKKENKKKNPIRSRFTNKSIIVKKFFLPEGIAPYPSAN